MTAELTTKKVSDVVQTVQRTFGDEDSTQIGPADIIGWINSGQREIIAHNPILQASLVQDMTTGVASIALPANRIQYIQAIYLSGKPLIQMSYNEAQQFLQDYYKQEGSSPEQQVDPSIWYEWAGNVVLFPVPYQDVAGAIQMDCVLIPDEVLTVDSPLSIPDRYFEALVQYVLSQARTLDETYDAATFHQTNFSTALGQLSDQENRVQVKTYPTIFVRDEDL